jgi:hypothetical protein
VPLSGLPTRGFGGAVGSARGSADTAEGTGAGRVWHGAGSATRADMARVFERK